MPDWSYRTLFRPLLFCLPAEWSRAIALGGMGRLARTPGGGWVIDQMGHMAPSMELAFENGPLSFPSRVGLSHRVDPTGSAYEAFARFGFGCIELGPLDLSTVHNQIAPQLDIAEQAIALTEPAVSLTTLRSTLSRRCSVDDHRRPARLLRVTLRPLGPVLLAALRELAPQVDALILVLESQAGEQTLAEWIPALREAVGGTPLLLQHPAEQPLSAETSHALQQGHLHGLVVEFPPTPRTLAPLSALRKQVGPNTLLIVRGHVIDPQDALDLRVAGADLVLIDEGLVFSGPGLAKRINEAELAQRPVPATNSREPQRGIESWVWTLLQGIALFGGGWLALAIAVSRVMLPYDEDFVGMNRQQLCGVNPKLVDFMCHDRVTLAGTMVSLGLCYSLLSIYGSRRGRHWAQVAILASAFVGFFTFFAFLGYGYFDPFHAFVAAILFQLQLFGLAAPRSPVADRVTPTLREDPAWRRAQWGQLVLIGHATALIVAGLVIVGIGSTSVFVTEDLEFMNTTSAALTEANPRIIPLVAHDRASFGGMLLACGVVTLLPVLWGLERGRPWLWWMLLAAGFAGYIPAIGVHYAVGYTSLWHLAPAFGGAAVLSVGLGLTWGYTRPASHSPMVKPYSKWYVQ